MVTCAFVSSHFEDKVHLNIMVKRHRHTQHFGAERAASESRCFHPETKQSLLLIYQKACTYFFIFPFFHSWQDSYFKRQISRTKLNDRYDYYQYIKYTCKNNFMLLETSLKLDIFFLILKAYWIQNIH